MGTVGVAAGGQPPRARSICVSHLLLYPPQGSRTAVVGVPDMGAVCTKTHVPGYIASLAALRAAGVDRVLVVAPGDPTTVQAWAAKLGVSDDAGAGAAADSGDFARLLGVDAPQPPAPAPQAAHAPGRRRRAWHHGRRARHVLRRLLWALPIDG